tara:strand:+ start:765 stop:2003 length:1239 start_codon:yes stop_codon:yes gene_type:complete
MSYNYKQDGIVDSSNNVNTQNFPGISPGRVTKAIIEGQTYPNIFNNLGKYQSLGGVFFTSLNNPSPNPFPSDQFALPLFSNISNVPLKNEIIYVIKLPDTNVQANVNSVTNYYFQPVNVWNSIHHNAIPDPIQPIENEDGDTDDYKKIGGGLVRQVTDGSTKINLGDTFIEKIDTRKLRPFEGDIIYEGRWGQSLRFGSTVSNSIIPNPWSSTGEGGDPITIIRNGQHEENNDAWVPQVEDINTDPSSIYLTSNQLIPISGSSTSYLSYFSPPTAIDKYNGEQIILNSGRLLLNSKTDSILLSSFNSINLNSINSVNIDSNAVLVKSKNIALGDKNASEPVILGNLFLKDFEELCKNINALATVFQKNTIGGPGNISAPILGLAIPAIQLANASAKMLNRIKDYKSKTTTTI